MKFSIIVPIYKVEEFLVECIESVLNQNYEDFELILVDDGSPDKCPQICDSYAKQDERIVVVHKSNGGIVSARAAGVAVAKGGYVVCLDGDDYLDFDYLNTFKRAIDRYNPDIVCCGAHYVSLDKVEDVPILQFNGFYDRKKMEKEIFPYAIHHEDVTYFPPSLWAKAFKLDLYQQQQLVNSKIKIGEDGACVIPCIINAQSISVIDYCGYNYRQNCLSMTKSKKAFDLYGPIDVYNHIKSRVDLSSFDFEQQLNRKLVHDLFTVAVSQFNKKDSNKNIKKEIKNALSNEMYSNAVQNAHFKRSFKAKIMHFSLKHNFMFLLKIYSRMR